MFSCGILLPLAFAVMCVACHEPVEDREHHVVHRGEMAKLTVKGGDSVYLAVERGDGYHVQEALSDKNTAKLEEMVSAGKAIKVAAGTMVKVLTDSYNERRVEVAEGPLAGKSGWVVWENLRSLDRTDR